MQAYMFSLFSLPIYVMKWRHIRSSHELVENFLLSSPSAHLLGAARIVVTDSSFSDAALLCREALLATMATFGFISQLVP
ncbi:hypothetical protein Bca4012_026836 [Brassica carinata]